MQKPIEQSSCHFPANRRRCSTVGIGLIFVMISVTILLIGLTVALPSVLQQGQREREAEAIFRGTEYARAIALFHRRFRRYPASVDELLHTNMLKFLRQEYTDPLDPNGKWRFIHVNAAGVIVDSKTNLFGTNKPAQKRNLSAGNHRQRGTASGTSSQGFGPSQASTGDHSSKASSTSSLSDSPVHGGFIIGVAPTSHARSIRVWNKQDEYDKWEFLGIDLQFFARPTAGPKAPSNGNRPTPNQGGAPGAPSPTSRGDYSNIPTH